MAHSDLGMLQMQILWLLENQPIHGYALMKRLNAMKKTKVTQGTLYPTMQKLVSLGYVSTKEDGNRKVYYLTAKGKSKMDSACAEFVSMFKCIFEKYSYGSPSSAEEHRTAVKGSQQQGENPVHETNLIKLAKV